MLKVAAFTGGRHIPAARFRVRQYVDRLEKEGVEISEFPASLGVYPPKSRLIRPLWAMATLAARLPGIAQSYRYDLTLLQREMLSTFITMEPLTQRPRVLDVDDAIWLYRGGRFAETLAQRCESVICGNAFLADHFSQWNKNVKIVPTAVDTVRYAPGAPMDAPIIGWSGTSGGYEYFPAIEPALVSVLQKFPEARLRIVSDAMPAFQQIPESRVEYIRWTPENEVQAIQEMAVGIMPLSESLWDRGKCSFKMLTYMACGIPVVVSAAGMNIEVLSYGQSGFGAKSVDDWVGALSTLLEDFEQRKKMGRTGRQVILDRYSLDVVTPELAKALWHAL
ncbi:MAG: glycosyltransferase family 4 protein [Stenotrophobium sp.]